MSLIRKTRISGKSIVITLPSQIIEAYDIKHGDYLEITPLEPGTILMKKTTPKGRMQ
jgi:bifunctional DNA-binding transcriptional regulator/antitoxin component of YhaV-PrlF toxin-antitoxin module